MCADEQQQGLYMGHKHLRMFFEHWFKLDMSCKCLGWMIDTSTKPQERGWGRILKLPLEKNVEGTKPSKLIIGQWYLHSQYPEDHMNPLLPHLSFRKYQ